MREPPKGNRAMTSRSLIPSREELAKSISVIRPGSSNQTRIEELEYSFVKLYQSIVLSGGSTMYPGLSNRLEKEILDRYLDVVLNGNRDGLKKFRLRIEDPPRRKHMVHLGGAVLTELMKDAPEFWINKEKYQEEGIACFTKFRQP
ncbi:hypothetical protein ACSQ67_000776 [Phaseolus vulgaris]